MDPRDIALQIEEEIRAGSSSRAAPTKDANAPKRDKASTKKDTGLSENKTQGEVSPIPASPVHIPDNQVFLQASEAQVEKPRRQRAWKEAKKEAKRRRMEAKETGKLPRKEAERQTKAASNGDAKPQETTKVRKRDDVDDGVQTASKRKDGKASKESKKRKV